MVLLEIVPTFTCMLKTGDIWGSKYEYGIKEKGNISPIDKYYRHRWVSIASQIIVQSNSMLSFHTVNILF